MSYDRYGVMQGKVMESEVESTIDGDWILSFVDGKIFLVATCSLTDHVSSSALRCIFNCKI